MSRAVHIDGRRIVADDAVVPEYLQLDGAARLVSLSKTTLRRAIAAGTLPAKLATLTPGSRTRRLLIRRADLLGWVERSFTDADTFAAEADALVANVFGGRRRA